MPIRTWIRSDLPDVDALWTYSVDGGGGPGMGWSIGYEVLETTHPDLVVLLISTDESSMDIDGLEPGDDLPVDQTYSYNFHLDDGTCEVCEGDMFRELKRDTWMTDVLGCIEGGVPEAERPGE